MIIKTVFVAKIVDEEIVDDVECEVITMAQVSYSNASDGNNISESYTVFSALIRKPEKKFQHQELNMS